MQNVQTSSLPSHNNHNNRSLSPFHKYHQKCVCGICTCKKHYCPSQSHTEKVVPLSHHDYIDHGLQDRAGLMNPPSRYTPLKSDPNDYQSMYRMHYQPNAVEKRLKKKGTPYDQLNLPGYFDTEYQKGIGKTHDPKDAARAAFNPKEKPLASQPFNSNSTYRENYRPNPVDYKPYKRNDKYQDSKTPMDCRTIYKVDYVPHEMDKNKRGKGDYRDPNIKHGYIDEPISQYGKSYPAYGPEAYLRPDCPINVMPPRPGRPSPGRNHLYYNDDARDWD